ncbi:helicase-associated domain-containing protein [Cohnella faecalis]|uniref:Helicase XPB/Ssl2 N-terminal domain-containing protein n=1 Tax=Cohnella faecalis TaxID=2315694 RepID=A0A398CM04_9BACL|nr:helicase-associated domain-containing protein [Cohnella faecalis]RIE04376.1 hypothetical protein D3H35_07235 [Cohnella faecalis]
MDVKPSVERLPESIRKLIASSAIVRDRLKSGERLDEILSSRRWAAAWLSEERDRAEEPAVETLRLLLRTYAAEPFERENLERTAALHDRTSLSGAEIRVGTAKLRRSGVLFAVRKIGGEQLLYLPTDMYPLWERLLFRPTSEPLERDEAALVVPADAPFRLPLSLELLTCWSIIGSRGLSLTSKGVPGKPSAARVEAGLRLSSEELVRFGFSYPGSDQLAPQVALALDIGFCLGTLERENESIRIDKEGMDAWLSRQAIEADTALHRLAVNRYASAHRELHLAASIIASLQPFGWHTEEAFIAAGCDGEALDSWLGLLASFGWLQRGSLADRAAFRWSRELDFLKEPCCETNRAAMAGEEGCPSYIYVQPDAEIIVPPETGLADRWRLEKLADRVSADTLFVYRITPSSCKRASSAGYTAESVAEFLESRSGTPLPQPVSDLLRDCFGSLGQVWFQDVTLLRAADDRAADLLERDAALSGIIVEKIGSRDYIVRSEDVKAAIRMLEKLGLPPSEGGAAERAAKKEKSGASASKDVRSEGWIYCRHVLSFYEPDRFFPKPEELFPGMRDIPSVWIGESRTYHSSTCRQMIRQAIDWGASVRIIRDGKPAAFVPRLLESGEDDWRVQGWWKAFPDSEVLLDKEAVTVSSGDFSELMILIPSLDSERR